MTPGYAYVYVAFWTAACLIAATLYLRDVKSYALSSRRYWRFLLKPWKLVTFGVSAAGLTLIGPYSGDPTWDYVDALLISVLTFITAPWTIGVLYKTLKKQLPMKQAFVAFCTWMFATSWSYDLYLLVRDGYYPVTWLANLGASSLLYLCGGLLWSLDWNAERGVVLSFMEKEWPAPSSGPVFRKVFWPALVFMTIASVLILAVLLAGRR